MAINDEPKVTIVFVDHTGKEIDGTVFEVIDKMDTEQQIELKIKLMEALTGKKYVPAR